MAGTIGNVTKAFHEKALIPFSGLCCPELLQKRSI